MPEAWRTQRRRKQQKRHIYLPIPAACCSDPHSVLLKLIHVGCDRTRNPGVYRQPGMRERDRSWILLLVYTAEPLHVSANTVHHVSVAKKNQTVTKHHHSKQPVRNESCRVLFHRKVSVDNPQQVLQVQETGWWCLFDILNTVQVHLVPWSPCLETLITLPVLICVCVVVADAGASAFLCSCFRTDRVCGDAGAPLFPVRRRGSPVNVSHFGHRRPVLRTFCVFPITPVSEANLQLRRAHCCDFCSNLGIGSCVAVKKGG